MSWDSRFYKGGIGIVVDWEGRGVVSRFQLWWFKEGIVVIFGVLVGETIGEEMSVNYGTKPHMEAGK